MVRGAYKDRGHWKSGVSAAGEGLAFGGVPADRLLKKADNLSSCSS